MSEKILLIAFPQTNHNKDNHLSGSFFEASWLISIKTGYKMPFYQYEIKQLQIPGL